MAVEGNIKGIARILLEELGLLEGYRLDKNLFIDEYLANALASITAKLNREIAVLINRQGRVISITVGKDSTASLSTVSGNKNRGGGLSGMRLIHTHPSGSGVLSELDISLLVQLEPDCIIAIGVTCDGTTNDIGLAFAKDPHGQVEQKLLPNLASLIALDFISMIEEREKEKKFVEEEKESEGAVLAVLSLGRSDEEIAVALDELARLAETAGIEVLAKTIQKRTKPERATYIGKGKAEEISMTAQLLDADLIIFDDELSPAALFNLEKIIGRKVIDRTMLILDIFAARAKSNEGKLQVELAQLKYLLPRLTGQGAALSRLAGGIGTRGPGESKLEMDRRKIRKRISDLDRKLEETLRTRKLHKENRTKERLFSVALVGYTNAGKSTLLNILSGENTYSEDLLFATLDSLTRRVELPGGGCFLISDTVGFIRNLPHHLIAAFRSTLEEVREADLLIHVVDGSAPDLAEQEEAVMKVLKELKVLDKPIITVINKADIYQENKPLISGTSPEDEIIYISAREGWGIDTLLEAVKNAIPEENEQVEIFLPFDKGNILSLIHDKGRVLNEEYNDKGVCLKAELSRELIALLKREGLI